MKAAFAKWCLFPGGKTVILCKMVPVSLYCSLLSFGPHHFLPWIQSCFSIHFKNTIAYVVSPWLSDHLLKQSTSLNGAGVLYQRHHEMLCWDSGYKVTKPGNLECLCEVEMLKEAWPIFFFGALLPHRPNVIIIELTYNHFLVSMNGGALTIVICVQALLCLV